MTSIDYPHTGVGWSFPVRWQRVDGHAAAETATGIDKVKQSMELILRTDVGERWMRPRFGSGANEFVFESLTGPATKQLANRARLALKLFEPRILLDRIEAVARPDDARVDIVIEFRLDRHRRPTSLVVPFYPQPGTEQ